MGRTSIEASSRGCATVISNKGGLPETVTNGIILKDLTVESVYSSIKKLIDNKNSIKIKGIEILEKIKKENKPVIFFSIHSGNWEICVPILDKYGFNIGAIYRHINNIFFDKYILKKTYLE